MIRNLRDLFAVIDRRTRMGMMGLAASALVVALLEMLGIGLVLPLLQLAIAPEKLVDMPLLGPYATRLAAGENSVLVWAAGTLFLCYLIKNLALFGLTRLQKGFVFGAEHRFRTRLYRDYLERPYVETLSENPAEVARTLTRSVPQVFARIMQPSIELVTEAMLCTAALAVLISIEPVAASTAMVVLGSMAGGFFVAVRRHHTRWGRELEIGAAEMLKWINQGVGAAKEIRVLGCQEWVTDTFSKAILRVSICSYKSAMATQVPRLAGEVVVVGSLMVVMALVAARQGGLQQSLPILGVFAAAAMRLLPSANRMVQAASLIREAGAAMDHVRAAAIHARNDVSVEVGPPVCFRSTLALRNVNFTYAGAVRPAVEGIDMVLHRGETVALVGASGAGKSTLGDILLGLLRPSSGQILIDGIDVTTDVARWRHLIGFVPQNVYLIDDSIRRNVAFGLPNEAIEEARLKAALAAARLEDTVAGLPQGLDTLIGDRGTRLSGGQRQRVGIARALYHNPEILVLDEATSALDNETEQEITQAIDSLKGEKTVVIIAHRLSTLRCCDRFFMLEDGRVAASGAFDEVMNANAAFTRMVRLGETLDRQRL